MDAYDAIRTKLDVREFSPKDVSAEMKLKVLEAARLTQSGSNTQHWRFILVQDRKNLEILAKDSIFGKWVEQANFAVIVLTDPTRNYHMIDAGRAVQDMQLAAWSYGIASCVFMRVEEAELRRDFGIPKELNIAIVVGFGYPARKLKGLKNRKPLSEIACLEKYGSKFDASSFI